MKITRREILRFVGGSAAGLLLSPLPWKALNDTANWSQNFPWIPEPGRGEITHKNTICTLCPVGCGVRTRCAGKQVVSISGSASHPVNQGTVCPHGLVAHHLRYHPARVLEPLRVQASGQTLLTNDEVQNELATLVKSIPAAESVLFIDGRPERAISSVYKKFASAMPQGTYVGLQDSGLELLASMLEKPIGKLGFDVENAQTVLSFGVPLFDGWGTPAFASNYLKNKEQKKQRIIQVEPVRSRTANFADQWIPIRPGTEAHFALAIANVLLQEKLTHLQGNILQQISSVAAPFTPSVAADVCGVSPAYILDTARALVQNTPSLVIVQTNTTSNYTQAACMLLNILVGNIGQVGGVAVRQELPSGIDSKETSGTVRSLNEIPDHSVRMMVIDESLSGCTIPDAVLQQKLVPEKGVIVSLSPFITTRTFCIQYIIPTPVFLESIAEMPASKDSSVSTLSISAALVPAPESVVEPLQFLQRLAQTLGLSGIESASSEEILKKRVAAIHASAKGNFVQSSNGQSIPLKNVASADDLWNALVAGGCWRGEPSSLKSPLKYTLDSILASMKTEAVKPIAANGLFLVPCAEHGVYTEQTSPLMSKVGQESGFRSFGNRVYAHSNTIGQLGLVDGALVSLETKQGKRSAHILPDASIQPGALAVMLTDTSDARHLLELCETDGNASFLPTPVKIEKVS